MSTAQHHGLAPPLPESPGEIARVEHTRLRRRILYSMHKSDVAQKLVKMVGSERARAWAEEPDMTANPGWYVCSQLAALYREVPEVRPPDGAEEAAAAIAEAGYWQLAQRVQRDTIGLNDLFVRVDIDKDTKKPTFRLVPPDMCDPITHPFRPSQPVAMKEWIEHPDKPGEWVRLVVDPRKRIYTALDTAKNDVSSEVLGGDFSGDAYPFVVEGKPVLPYVAYHAAETGFGLDPFTGREVFDGVLQVGVFYSYFGHILRNAAWAQKYGINVEPAGADIEDAETGTRRKAVKSDPAVMLSLQAIEGQDGQAIVGQWANPVDPATVLASIERYERRIVEMALGQVGVSRRESDVRSAMSLAVSREAQREAQRGYEPVFRRSDLRLVSLVAGLMGQPTKDWRITYKSIPRDAHELDAEVKRMRELLDAGLLDKVTAYQQLHPGLTREEAKEALEQIRQTNSALA